MEKQLLLPSTRTLTDLCKDPSHFKNALRMASLMDQKGFRVPRDAIYHLLQQCSQRKDLVAVRQVNFLMINNKLDSIAVLADHLIRIFTLCGSLVEARRAFYKVVRPTVFTWNAIISAHVSLDRNREALLFYANMQHHGVLEDKVTFLTIIKASASPGCVKHGRQIHDKIIRIGLHVDIMIGNSLVDMYAKCESIDEARRVFDSLPERTVVSWSSMIKGHSLHGQGFRALDLLQKMLESSIFPDKVLFCCVVQACCMIEAVQYGRVVHHVLVESANASDTMIGTSLMDMYIKCGSLMDACKVFDGVFDHDVALWGSLIAGYAIFGNIDKAIVSLRDMQQEGFEPDEMIITCIISACSQHGLVEEGHKYFKFIESYEGKIQNIEHYNGMVDLLTRASSLEEAACLLQTMPASPDLIGWRCLLTGCGLYGNVSLARHCFNELVRLDPCDSSAYALMIDVYTKAEMWDDAEKLQQLRLETQMHSECKETSGENHFHLLDEL